MGDLNYNLLEFNKPHVYDFIQIMYEQKLHSTINKPTRITTKSATLIDHNWTDISHCKTSCGILVDSLRIICQYYKVFSLNHPP